MPLSTFRRRAEPGQVLRSHRSPGMLARSLSLARLDPAGPVTQLPTVGQEWAVSRRMLQAGPVPAAGSP